ncbi:RAS guanyl-releasing protein 4 isoform X1 [Oryzias melastigma]|uniref:RAS guanyl-releasing protein 4 isoform X1 n=2 Tax=Oryzias melastigma TaxID=30732 RepID=UPI000CF7C4B0|nr:RAS guanyl-releasing protein 4 isoform X1 [Oryzias melastigma]
MNKPKRKSNVETPGVQKGRKLVQRRRNTCPSPQDISRALQNPSPAPSPTAASLDELIQRCLHCFDSEGKISSPKGSQLVHMTLMMHSWVVPSQMFAQKLLALYKDCPSDKRGLRRAQICHLVRQWISQFPAVFEVDPLLEQTMGDLWALVQLDREKIHSQLIDTSCSSPHVNVSQAPSPCVKKRKVSLIFDHMEPDEMAEHLSYLEFKNFCNVSFLDYRSYVVRGSVRDNPALERSVMMCNGVSQWVQLMILSRHTAQQRAQVFTKFIHVAQKLRSLQNFNTLMAVTGGLCHSSISRLKDTSNLLPPDVTKALSEMTELLSSRSNYSNYRRVYNDCKGFKVPILGVHLKDLISLNEAMPDYIEEEKINLSKLQHLYSNINDLLAIHSCTPPFEANKDLLHLLTLSLDLYYTEDEIYELSYTKEPKNPKIQPVASVKPPVVAEWGSGVTPRLDPDTISKHVKQMVDSIMKNYDPNQEGYISLEEFEKIASNFPFSFCTQETDREGQISHEEITSYFMRGMSVCAKLGYNFNDAHNFHEITYKRPTFCDTCGGFLWGVIKQGYHCKDCGINCHRHCRDLVRMECLKKHKNTSGSCPCTPAPDSRAKGNSWSSEEETFVFPQSNETENSSRSSSGSKNNTDDSKLSDRSTQTEPGVWTPERDKRGERLNFVVHGSPERRVSLLPQRARGCSIPVSLLQKMEELHLHKDKSREPD